MTGWLDLLKAEVERSGNMAETARLVGVSRTAVSLALAGKYPTSTRKLESKVMAALSRRVECPHLGGSLTRAACADRSTRPMPQSSAAELRAWRACQGCDHRKKGKSP